MKIALIGYGKMGKAIENIALLQGHEIVLKINTLNTDLLSIINLQKCDVAIEFTGPETTLNNLKLCIDAGVPIVCGSTGWHGQEQYIKNYCSANNGALLYSSNFSIGVNIFFEINKKLATLIQNYKEYNVSIEETHHTQKKDAPSGTAITLAEQIIACQTQKNNWVVNTPAQPHQILITSQRVDPTPGTHTVFYQSLIDQIAITHTAYNRDGFAIGAILAAQFLINKKGVFNMADVLNYTTK